MELRLSAREGDASVIHLSAAQPIRHAGLVRARGQALCRKELPNLDLLDIQVIGDRKVCHGCIDQMARIRRHKAINLPASCGVLAGDPIHALEQERELSKPKAPKKRSTRFNFDQSL